MDRPDALCGGGEGAAATAMATASRACNAQQTEQEEQRAFHEKARSYPLRRAVPASRCCSLPTGGLNSTTPVCARRPSNAIEEFKGEYRCIFADLRNANGGNPPARSRSTAVMPTPMTTSA